MQPWFKSKLQHITDEYLQRGTRGDIFEAMYLCYVETWVAYNLGVKHSDRVWEEWTELCQQEDPEAEQPRNMAAYCQGKDLVDKFQVFQHRFAMPPRAKFKVPPKAEPEDLFSVFEEWSE